MSDATVSRWWEDRYAGTDGVWSGRANAVLADIATTLEPGTALDLGCGEGGDAVWLAARGWEVTGVDISPTAVDRARAAAVAAGLPAGRTRFIAADLAEWTTDERFDLVAASFLQSWPAAIPRDEILRRASGLVAPGGHLLVVAHAAPPAGMDEVPDHAQRFPSPEADLATLDLDPAGWSVLLAETRSRPVAARPGEHGDEHGRGYEHRHVEVIDGIVLAARR